MDFKTMKIEDIIKWCQDNNEVEWLKAKAQEKVDFKVYPKKVVDGKTISDKTQEPTIEKRPITFMQIKLDFVDKFMPEIKPKAKEKKPNMYDLIASL